MSCMDAQLTPPVFMLCISWPVCPHASQQGEATTEEKERRQQEKGNNTLHDILAVSLVFSIETQKEHIEEKRGGGMCPLFHYVVSHILWLCSEFSLSSGQVQWPYEMSLLEAGTVGYICGWGAHRDVTWVIVSLRDGLRGHVRARLARMLVVC